MDKRFGSKRQICFILVVMILVILGNAYAAAPNVGNLDKYNFDTPKGQDIQNYSISKSVFTFFTYLFLFIVISILAFYTTRWIAKFQGYSQPKSKYMEVIDFLPLGSNRGIYIVKTPEGLMMMGVSEKKLFMISKLDSDKTELINEVESNSTILNKTFSNQLDTFLRRFRGEPGEKNSGDDS